MDFRPRGYKTFFMTNSTEHEFLLRFCCIHRASSSCIHHAFVVFILTFMSIMDTTFESLKVKKIFIQQLKFYAQLS